MYKKAQSAAEKSVFYLIFGFVCTVIFLLLLFIVGSEGLAQTIIPKDIENAILIQRFLNSPNCFAHQDSDTLRIYPRLIDWSIFNENSLDNCYPFYNSDIVGFRLTLSNTELNEDRTIATKNWEGYVSEIKKEKNIRVYKDGNMYAGELKIEIQKKSKKLI